MFQGLLVLHETRCEIYAALASEATGRRIFPKSGDDEVRELLGTTAERERKQANGEGE